MLDKERKNWYEKQIENESKANEDLSDIPQEEQPKLKAKNFDMFDEDSSEDDIDNVADAIDKYDIGKF